MTSKKIFILTGTLMLLGYCAFKQMAFKPDAATLTAQFAFMAVLLVALVAFLKEESWAPCSILLCTIFFYDVSLWISPPLPKNLIWLYTALAFLGALLYFSVNQNHLVDLKKGLLVILDHPGLKAHRFLLAWLTPFWAAALVLASTSAEMQAPAYPRIIHPEPPGQSDFRGKSYNLAELENPFRKLEKEDPQKFQEAVEEGKRVYYQNCFYCHGDFLDGKGHFAPALDPPPANFRDPGTIAMLQESFVFWRVSKGGPGLPSPAHPWNSAMPAWEGILTEDEIWKSILWIYSATGQTPRTWEK